MSTSPTPADNRKWWTLFCVCLATFMLLLDVTIVNVALKTIEVDLGSSLADLQWVVDAYALSLAALLLTFGSTSDILGRRRMFVLGMAWFAAASLLCALSVNPLMLNLSRALQGIGAAGMFATTLALIAQEFHGKERGSAFGIWGATTGGAVAIGPLVGGALTDAFGWQSIFLVNVPVGIATIALTLWKVPKHATERHVARIDFAGLVTFSVALFLLIFGLVRGNASGWTSTSILTCLIGAVVLLVAFIAIESRLEHPMLDLSLFKVPTFIGASAAALTLSGSIFALFLYITLYFQNVLHYTPLETGIRFLPNTVLSFVVAAVAGKASAHISVKALMTTGLVCIAAGLLWMQTGLSDTAGWSDIIGGLCLTGVGVGLVNPPLASTAVGVVSARRSGMAGGINATFRQAGLATGIAGLGAIFQHRVTTQVFDSLGNSVDTPTADRIAHSVSNGGTGGTETLPAVVQQHAQQAIAHGFVSGMETIFFWGAIVAIAGAVLVLTTVHKRDFVQNTAR